MSLFNIQTPMFHWTGLKSDISRTAYNTSALSNRKVHPLLEGTQLKGFTIELIWKLFIKNKSRYMNIYSVRTVRLVTNLAVQGRC